MPTIQMNSNLLNKVYPGGSVDLAVQFETYDLSGLADNASDVTLGIAAAGNWAGGSGVPMGQSADGLVNIAEGLWQYTWDVLPDVEPGDYVATWSGTRASDGQVVNYVQTIAVQAVPSSTPSPGTYATVKQYQDRCGDTYTPTDLVAMRLIQASEQIDFAIIGAVYATDADGNPQSPLLADALKRATCEQVRYLNANDDDSNIKGEFASMNVAGKSYSRSAKTQGNAFPRICPQALIILKNAGVLPKAALVNW